MLDPRSALYGKLEELGGNAELIAQAKSYFEYVIGKTGAATARATEAEAAVATLTEQADQGKTALAELDTLRGASTDAEKTLATIQAEVSALKESGRVSAERAAGLERDKIRAATLDAIRGKLANVDAVALSGVLSSIHDNGYNLDGKQYTAGMDGDSVQIKIDGVAGDLDAGILSLMESGLKSHVTGDAGGGAGVPQGVGGAGTPVVSMADAINNPQ